MIWCGGSQKSAGISGKRRTRLRSSRRNWSFGDFCRHSCVRSSRYLLERFSPLVRSLGESKRAGQRRSGTRASEPISCALLHPPPVLLLPAANALASRPYAPLSSSLIEYSPLYLRMPVEIYRRSRCSFRFNPLRPALTSSVLSFSVFAYILRV